MKNYFVLHTQPDGYEVWFDARLVYAVLDLRPYGDDNDKQQVNVLLNERDCVSLKGTTAGSIVARIYRCLNNQEDHAQQADGDGTVS